MARPRKVVRARKPESARDDSLLIRSAKSLGRVIGTLQRQMRGGTIQLSARKRGAAERRPERPARGEAVGARTGSSRTRPRAPGTPARKTATSRKTGGTGTSEARKAGARKHRAHK